MILGTGVDIIEVDRVSKKLELTNGLREKIFSSAEILFCESKANKAQHYAARFAAKEAFLKATGLGLMAGNDLHQIEIVSDANGKPDVSLYGDFKTLSEKNNWKKIHVSFSHLASMACAFVIIEG